MEPVGHLQFPISKKRCLLTWQWQAEMLVGEARGDPASWGSVKEAMLDQERLVDFFESVLLFGERGCEGIETHRAAVILFNYRKQQAAVEFVEAMVVNFEHFEGVLGDFAVN